MIRKLAVIFCFICFAGAAAAQQPTLRDPLLDHLAGHWVMTGTIAGHQVTHDVSAVWVLNHQYIEFREVSRAKNKDGDPDYQATVYIGWDQPLAHYDCVWLDVYGSISTQSLGHAPPNGDTIAFVFQDRDDTAKFRTTLTFKSADNSWTINMDQDADGKLSPFARTTLTAAK